MTTKPASSLLKGERVDTAECKDECETKTNPCKNLGRCVNLFTRAGCDCFGTGYEGAQCTKSKHDGDKIFFFFKDFHLDFIRERKRSDCMQRKFFNSRFLV